MMQEPTHDRSVTDPDGLMTGDDYTPIPFEDAPLPAANPDALARPLVAARKWRQEFSGDGAGRDGSPEWYAQNGGDEQRPEQATIDYVISLQ